MHTFKSRRKATFAYFPLIAALLMFSSATLWAQTQQEEVAAATNPAGEVADEIPADAQSITEGQTLFSQHCTVCHGVGQQIIGPALASVHNRRPINWLVRFIQNSQHVIIDEEDEYAQHLYEQYNQQVMPNFEFLSRGEILNILAYIKVESSSTTAGVSSVSESKANITEDAPSDEAVANSSLGPERGGTSTTTIVLVGVVLLLLLVVIVMATRGRSKSEA